jgi:dCTP diphosphatase
MAHPRTVDSRYEQPGRRCTVREEIADVGIYLLRLAVVLQVDLLPAVSDKLQANAERYPADLARGHATKYDRLGGHA